MKQLRPDLIVCTHPFPNAVISRLKRKGIQVPLITLITDYDVHATWVNKEVNQYLVSTPQVRNLLLRRNVLKPSRSRLRASPSIRIFGNEGTRSSCRKNWD